MFQLTLTCVGALMGPAAAGAAGSHFAGGEPGVPVPCELPDDADEQLEDLVDEYDQALAAFWAAYGAETDEAKRQAIIDELYPQPAEFGPPFKQLASAFSGTDAAAGALVWIAVHVYGDSQDAAVDELLADYSDRSVLAEIVPFLASRQDPESRKHLRSLLADSPHRNVRGQACRALALNLRGLAEDAQEADLRGRLLAECRALLVRVQKEFADIPIYNSTLGESARGELFEMDRLQIGMVAPDIEGADLDGVEFKLSDYRGKVVVIDFWGHW